MEKCKYCQQELEEGSTICPHCGKENAEEASVEVQPAAEQEVKPEEAPAVEETGTEEKAGQVPAEEAKEEENTEETSEEKEPAGEEKAAEPAVPEAASKSQEKKKATPGQIALAVGAVVVLAAVLIALIISALGQKKETAAVPETEPVVETTEYVEPTIPADGNPDDVTCKGTYTADAEAVQAGAGDVVATIAEYQLTNSQLQVYYWQGLQSLFQSSPYMAYLINPEVSLDMQVCPIAEGLTWQQFLLQTALETWHNDQAMNAEAVANKMPENPEITKFLKGIPADLEKMAEDNGFASVQEMLHANFGPATTMEDFMDVMELMNIGQGYYMYFMSVAMPDDAELEEYYQKNEAQLLEGGISKASKSVDVRHVLITPEDTEDEAAWKAAEEKAQELLKGYEAGKKTEDAFAAMATEHTQDPGSQATGGLYKNVVLGQMVPEFEDWCFDEGRTVGDTGLVKTDYGYHIMYYVGDQLIWKDQVAKIILDEKTTDFMQRNAATYPMHVDYSKILLGEPVAAE